MPERGLDISMNEMAFLEDLAAFPEGGVAERYKRLGLSVRQGQKVKEALAGKRMIQEQVQTTRFGKLRVIRLTEKARLSMSETEESISEAV